MDVEIHIDLDGSYAVASLGDVIETGLESREAAIAYAEKIGASYVDCTVR